VLFLSSSSRSVGSAIQSPSAAHLVGEASVTSASLSSTRFRAMTEAVHDLSAPSVVSPSSSPATPHEAINTNPPPAAAAAAEEGEWKSSYDPILAAVLGKIYIDADRLEIATTGQAAASVVTSATTSAAQSSPVEGGNNGQGRRDSTLTIRPALHKLLSLHEAAYHRERRHSATWDASRTNAKDRRKKGKKLSLDRLQKQMGSKKESAQKRKLHDDVHAAAAEAILEMEEGINKGCRPSA
jgi:hypothetical protein